MIMGALFGYYFATNLGDPNEYLTLFGALAFFGSAIALHLYGPSRCEFFPERLRISRGKRVTMDLPYSEVRSTEYPSGRSKTLILITKSGSQILAAIPKDERPKPGIPFAEWLDNRVGTRNR